MEYEDRVRGTGIGCCHFLRNAAYYRTGWEDGALHANDPFWVTVNDNFLKCAVREWCELFADKKSDHYWQVAVASPTTFWADLLRNTEMTQDQFETCAQEMRLMRDASTVLSDSERTPYFPEIDFGIKTVRLLYDDLARSPTTGKFMPDACSSGAKFVGICLYQALRAYGPPTPRRTDDCIG